MTESHSSSLILAIQLSRAIPTLFTRMSTRPKRSTLWAISASAPSLVLTSATTGNPTASSASRSFSACPILSATMSFSTTLAPARASLRAIPAPMPCPEPVTTATRLFTCISSSSSSRELGLALLDERLHAFPAVLAGAQQRVARRLEGESGVQVRVQRLVHSRLDPSEREGCTLGDLHRQRQGVRCQGRVRHDPVDKTDARGLDCADLLTEEHELLGPSGTNQTGHALGTASAGHAADLGLGKPEPCLFRGDPQVARKRKLQPPAERVPLDHRDHRGLELLEPAEHLVHQGPELILAGPGVVVLGPGPSGQHRRRMPSPRSPAAPPPECCDPLVSWPETPGGTPASPRSSRSGPVVGSR